MDVISSSSFNSPSDDVIALFQERVNYRPTLIQKHFMNCMSYTINIIYIIKLCCNEIVQFVLETRSYRFWMHRFHS